ncbi:choice-of-anchor M domain-containing protein [Streptomyces sp. YIM 98790]|uniref:choice-of-anchor M domain-containing protein n=1 Tax=Streptomyces sp. YIM 98790 TaxID=2689077 RepID=UPI0014087267|nr:choice-of-anchor M domain-containing protein [Streptomyces sp. YIM 98790]
MRVLPRFLTVAGGVAAALSCAALTNAYAATPLSQGHVDVIAVEVSGGAFDVHVHDETNEVEYDPADVTLVALPGSAYTVPSSSCYGFLGTGGSTVYRLPQIENTNLLWPGIAAEIEDGVLQNDALTIELTSVSGPGNVSIYTNSFCPAFTRLVDSGNGISTADRFTLDSHEHLHANWAFTKAGAYTVGFTVRGTLANGTPLAPVTEEFTFSVG